MSSVEGEPTPTGRVDRLARISQLRGLVFGVVYCHCRISVAAIPRILESAQCKRGGWQRRFEQASGLKFYAASTASGSDDCQPGHGVGSGPSRRGCEQPSDSRLHPRHRTVSACAGSCFIPKASRGVGYRGSASNGDGDVPDGREQHEGQDERETT